MRYGGLTDGVPKWMNGLRYLISYSTIGELHGVPRSVPQVVANGFDMGGSAITRSAIQLGLSQRRARIKESEVGTDFFYTHDSQVNSLKEIGYDLQYIPLVGGEAAGFDPWFRGAPTIEGKAIKWGQHADQQAWYLITPKAVGRVMFKEPYFPLSDPQRHGQKGSQAAWPEDRPGRTLENYPLARQTPAESTRITRFHRLNSAPSHPQETNKPND